MLENGGFLGKARIRPRMNGESHAQLLACSELDHIKYCIRSLLLTRKGERAFSPQLGGSLMSFLFQHYQSNVVYSIQSEMTRVIESYEPRIRVQVVNVERDERNPQLIEVELKYQVISTGEIDGLMFRIQP